MASFSAEAIGGSSSKAAPLDIEDLFKRLTYRPSSTNLPLIIECDIVHSSDFVADEKIRSDLEKIKATYPAGRHYVVRVSGKLANDIAKLNEKILFVESLLPEKCRILLDISFERLIAIAELPNTALLKSRIYPSVRYYVPRDGEQQCIDEIQSLIRSLASIDGIQLVVTLCVDRPLPRFGPILRFLRSHVGFIRFITISYERSPSEMMNQLTASSSKKSSTLQQVSETMEKLNLQHGSQLSSIDPYEIVQSLVQESDGILHEQDFVPWAVSRVMEPFFSMLNYGKFSMRASPFCGFGACLINTEEYRSHPISRFVDLQKFYQQIYPLLLRLDESTTLNLMTAQKIRKIIKECGHPGVTLPDILAYFIDPRKADVARKFVANMQFIVLHNNMDIFAFDMVRRCNCATISTSNLTANGIAASCTGGCL
eukprot:TRINITY_DN7167_c0_g1_i2.p1 TRINITY_DN7167_c0_g1~~TRINITY_DN7167_c0_g1_i2.p1  ORF type:complete len:427 (+),score=88.00 TRINITY_DN7167_c0_g1_i2:371-1651(+)